MATVDCREGLLATCVRLHEGLTRKTAALRTIIAADVNAQASLLTKQMEAANELTDCQRTLAEAQKAVKEAEEERDLALNLKKDLESNQISLDSQNTALKTKVDELRKVNTDYLSEKAEKEKLIKEKRDKWTLDKKLLEKTLEDLKNEGLEECRKFREERGKLECWLCV